MLRCTIQVLILKYYCLNRLTVKLLETVNAPLKKRVRLRGAVSRSVADIDDFDGILTTGIRLRQTRRTAMNDQSSRSHCVFTISVHQEYIPDSSVCRDTKINFVDLAGSEKGYQRSICTTEVILESSEINSSLSTLNACLRALTSRKHPSKYIPYRDSKLTWLLQDSLGGNCRLVLLATVSPAESSYSDTKSTLMYASKAKKIPTHLIRNNDDKFLQEEARRVREGESYMYMNLMMSYFLLIFICSCS
jgi:kinesin family protein 15